MSVLDNTISNANSETLKTLRKVENGIDTKNVKINKFFALGKEKSPINMYVNGKEFTQFNSLRISYSIDSACSAFSFDTIFYPSKGTSNTIKPFGYESVKILYNNKTIFNGYIEKITTGYSNNGSNLNIQGRSLGGILVDSDIKKSYYQTTTLTNLAQLNGFLFLEVNPDERFQAVNIDEGENFFGIISKYASQKGLFAIPKLDGGLLFKKINRLTDTGFKIEDGSQNVLGISANFDITKRFFEYIGIKRNVSPKSIFDSSISTKRGLRYYRGDDLSGNTEEIAKKARSRMISESFTLAVSLSTWTLNDELLLPGILCKIKSPMNMIYNSESFVIKQIDYTYDINNGYLAEIQFTLPEAYTGENINPLFFGTFTEKDRSYREQFFRIPDNKEIYDKVIGFFS